MPWTTPSSWLAATTRCSTAIVPLRRCSVGAPPTSLESPSRRWCRSGSGTAISKASTGTPVAPIAVLVRRCRWQRNPSDTARFEEASRRRFIRGEGLPGRVWADATAAWMTGTAEDTDFPRAAVAAADGLRSAFAVPIQADGKVVAVAGVELLTHELARRAPTC